MDTDEKLATGLAARDEKALEALIEKYGGLIKAIVSRHLSRMPSHIGECVNDILFSVWSNIDRFDPGKNSLKNWIGAISKYKCIDYKRKYFKELCSEELSPEDLSPDAAAEGGAEDALIQKETMAEIMSLLSCLKPRDRRLFYRRYILSEPVREIAEKSGEDPAVIYNRLSRGRKKLRHHLLRSDIYEK